MYRTIFTSAAVAVAALAIVAGASAMTRPAGCSLAIPNTYVQAKACAAAKQAQRSNRAVASATSHAPVACLYAMPTSLVQAQVCGSAPYASRSVAAAKTTPPVGCKYAMPASRAQAIACSERDVNAPLSPAVLAGIRKAQAAAKGLPLSPDVRQEIYDANQRVAAAVPPAGVPKVPLSPDVRQAIYDANHRVSESVPQTASEYELDPAIARAIQQEKDRAANATSLEEGLDPTIALQLRQAQAARSAANASASSDPGFDWGSAGIGAAAGALLLIAAVGSGAILRRRRPLLHA